jgi:hypothetical protein
MITRSWIGGNDAIGKRRKLSEMQQKHFVRYMSEIGLE